jgi:hypothetical protein
MSCEVRAKHVGELKAIGHWNKLLLNLVNLGVLRFLPVGAVPPILHTLFVTEAV